MRPLKEQHRHGLRGLGGAHTVLQLLSPQHWRLRVCHQHGHRRFDLSLPAEVWVACGRVRAALTWAFIAQHVVGVRQQLPRGR